MLSEGEWGGRRNGGGFFGMIDACEIKPLRYGLAELLLRFLPLVGAQIFSQNFSEGGKI